MCTNCPVVEYIEHLEYQISIVEYSTQNAVSTNGGNGDDSIQQLLNDTDSELSGLSHLDAPNESLYMIGGVLIAMFLVGVIIILLAVTISKLRKREEHNNTVHPTDVVLQTATTTTPLPTQPSTIVVSSQTEPVPYHGQVLWQFPPQPQHLYSNNQETLVQSIPTERPGFVQGFRKNLGGRWRRLVKKKPTPEVYTIPPELRPQLKTIYVY